MGGQYSILNPWYDRFSEFIDQGREKEAIAYYQKSFPTIDVPDSLNGARDYIVSRLRLDFDVADVSITSSRSVGKENSLDYQIKAICQAVCASKQAHSTDISARVHSASN